jgi:hypothetical protein
MQASLSLVPGLGSQILALLGGEAAASLAKAEPLVLVSLFVNRFVECD